MFGHDPFLYPTLSAGLQAFVPNRLRHAAAAHADGGAAARAAVFPKRALGRICPVERGGGRGAEPVRRAVAPGAVVASALGLVVGHGRVAAAGVNLLLCYYFFIRMRWRGVLRGMGAPGFIAFWLGAAVLLLELTSRHAPALHGLALLTVQVDFA